MRILLAAFLALVTGFAAQPSPAQSKDGVVRVNLGRYINLRCNFLPATMRHEFEWQVELKNLATANDHGRSKLDGQLKKARKQAADPRYADCGAESSRAMDEADFILNRSRYKNALNYRPAQSYHDLLSARFTQVLVGLVLQKACDKGTGAYMTMANMVKKTRPMYDQFMGAGSARKSGQEAKRELTLDPIKACDAVIHRKIRDAFQTLIELRTLLKQELQMVPRREMVAAKSRRPIENRRLSQTDEIEVKVSPRGYVSVGRKTPLHKASLDFEAVAKLTLSGRQHGDRKPRLPSAVLLIPRDQVHPLGTVFKRDKGYASLRDDRAAETVKGGIVTRRFPRVVFHAPFLEPAIAAMLESDGEALKTIGRFFAGDPDRLDYPNFTVLAEDVEVAYLPAATTETIGPLVETGGAFDGEGYYLVADKIVRARKVAYFVGPARLGDGLDEAAFDRAVDDNPDISTRDGAYVIERAWKEAKVIALDYSVLGLTKIGKRRIKIPSFAGSPKVLIALSQASSDLLGSKP